VKGRWACLCHAVNKHGAAIEFCLSPTRNAKAAKRFVGKALRRLKREEQPTVINTDKAGCYGPAIAALRKKGLLSKAAQHRQVRHLNDVVEADHGKLKRLIHPTLGSRSLRTAHAAIKGFEVMRALEKGQGSVFRYLPGVAGEVSLANRNFGLC
jgi:transposase-like protein